MLKLYIIDVKANFHLFPSFIPVREPRKEDTRILLGSVPVLDLVSFLFMDLFSFCGTSSVLLLLISTTVAS